jgi:DNA-damage-inducible protein J
MEKTTMIHVRIDTEIKDQASKTLSAMGLSVSDAVRVFLVRVVAEKKMPFVLEAPADKKRRLNSRKSSEVNV